jgi:mannose-6-phosphate isomerase-like protein (cupin superfamily)
MEDETVPVTSLEGFGGQSGPTKDFKLFRYTAPTSMKRDRALVPLARSDILLSMVQIFRGGGGEQEMHAHTAMDGFWFVLRGRARFYGDNNVLVADLGEHEGIFVPRNAKYWFEAGECEQLELLQVEAIDHRVKNEMIRYDEQKEPATVEVYKPEGVLIAGNVKLGPRAGPPTR